MKICGLILAAGGSSRLGRPKQLVMAGNNTLLQKATESAIEAGLNPVYIVLGAQIGQIKKAVEHLPVNIIHNQEWQKGIGSSIGSGMEAIMAAGQNFDGLLIMLCDQLYVNSTHLESLVRAFSHKKAPIIATQYAGQPGVPAIFGQKYFPLLARLSGDTGAKKIISRHPADVHTILFEEAKVDIDTPDDLIKTGLT